MAGYFFPDTLYTKLQNKRDEAIGNFSKVILFLFLLMAFLKDEIMILKLSFIFFLRNFRFYCHWYSC